MAAGACPPRTLASLLCAVTPQSAGASCEKDARGLMPRTSRPSGLRAAHRVWLRPDEIHSIPDFFFFPILQFFLLVPQSSPPLDENGHVSTR